MKSAIRKVRIKGPTYELMIKLCKRFKNYFYCRPNLWFTSQPNEISLIPYTFHPIPMSGPYLSLPFLLFALLCAGTCVAQDKTPFMYEYFGNLQGTWCMQKGDKLICEEWKFLNDSTLAGRSYRIKSGDTVLVETITLQRRGTTVKYIPVVSGQNNGAPVEFVLEAMSSTKEKVSGKNAHSRVEAVFANPLHDSPRYIAYTISPAAVRAQVADDKEFKLSSLQFDFIRQKN